MLATKNKNNNKNVPPNKLWVKHLVTIETKKIFPVEQDLIHVEGM